MNTRNTKAKEAIARIFQVHARPLSLTELHKYLLVSLPSTAYSTVFRLVSALEEEKKVVRIDWRERGSRYEWADLPHHHHIVCQVCGKVVDVDCDLFKFREQDIETATGFSIQHHSIEFEGICRDCQKK